MRKSERWKRTPEIWTQERLERRCEAQAFSIAASQLSASGVDGAAWNTSKSSQPGTNSARFAELTSQRPASAFSFQRSASTFPRGLPQKLPGPEQLAHSKINFP